MPVYINVPTCVTFVCSFKAAAASAAKFTPRRGGPRGLRAGGVHHDRHLGAALGRGVGGAPLPDVVSDKAVEFLALHAAGRVYGGPIVLTAEKRAVTVKDTLVAKLNHQAVLMHFKNPGQAQLAELRGAVGR